MLIQFECKQNGSVRRWLCARTDGYWVSDKANKTYISQAEKSPSCLKWVFRMQLLFLWLQHLEFMWLIHCAHETFWIIFCSIRYQFCFESLFPCSLVPLYQSPFNFLVTKYPCMWFFVLSAEMLLCSTSDSIFVDVVFAWIAPRVPVCAICSAASSDELNKLIWLKTVWVRFMPYDEVSV